MEHTFLLACLPTFLHYYLPIYFFLNYRHSCISAYLSASQPACLSTDKHIYVCIYLSTYLLHTLYLLTTIPTYPINSLSIYLLQYLFTYLHSDRPTECLPINSLSIYLLQYLFTYLHSDRPTECLPSCSPLIESKQCIPFYRSRHLFRRMRDLQCIYLTFNDY